MKKPARIEIPAFPKGKRIALTTSFDDGHTHDRRLIEAFNEWNIKGTFNLNSGLLRRSGGSAPDGARSYLDVSEIAALYQGHEVAIHTLTHPHLTRLDPSQVVREVLDDRKALEDIVGYPVRGMAYPFGSYNSQTIEILRSLGIVYARTADIAPKCYLPEEPLAWAMTAHQYAADPTVPEHFKWRHENPRFTGVISIWGHGFEFHDRNDWSALDRIFKPLAGKPDVWYCTNIELFDYEAARRRVVIAANMATAFNPSALNVTLKVDDQMIEVPGGALVNLA